MGFVGASVAVGAGVVLSAEKNSHDYYVQHGGAETRTMMGVGWGVRISYIGVLPDEFQQISKEIRQAE